MIDVYPTKFEAYDNDDGMFKVSMFDSGGAEIKIDTVCNVKLWDEISPLIRQCLVDMQFEGDKEIEQHEVKECQP